jgi:MoxR-like ATPase
MSLTTIEAMTQVVDEASGRMTEEAYLNGLVELVHSSGRTTSLDSMKVNAFNKKRMDKAGVCRVTIGTDRQVWSTDLAMRLTTDAPINMTTAPKPAPLLLRVPVKDTPAATVQVGGVFMGIPRNSPEAVSAMSDYLKSLIPDRRVFVESARQEYRLLANRYRRSLNGQTTKAHMLVVGPTGCGKSELVKSFFHEVQVPLVRMNFSDGVTEDQFIGTRTLVDGEVVFQDGIGTMAAELGLPFLADEINGARENILMALNGLMDTGMLVIPEDNNRVVKAKAGFMVVGTMNPPEDYAGVNEMNMATKNRFTYSLPFTYLEPALERKVIMDQTGCTDADLVKNIVALANDLRRLKRDNQLETDTSTRMLVQVVDELQDLSVQEAIDYVMLGRYTADERPQVQASARARLEHY